MELGSLVVRALNGEALNLRISQAYIAPVDIAIYCAEGAEGFEALGYVERTYVAGMPHLVALGKVLGIALVPMAMGVREEPDAFHYFPILLSI